jgi:hypothetical protein
MAVVRMCHLRGSKLQEKMAAALVNQAQVAINSEKPELATVRAFFVVVRTACALTSGCKACCELITQSNVKRNRDRVNYRVHWMHGAH